VGAEPKKIGGPSEPQGVACSPSKDCGASGGTVGVAADSRASREVRCSPECCMRRACGLIGWPPPPRPRHFWRSRRFVPTPSPDRLRDRVHPLVSFTPLQSAPIPYRPSPRGAGSFPGVAGPSWRHQSGASLWRASISATVRPRRFSRPRRFHPRPALRVCFAPQPPSGFRPSGVFPPTQPAPSPRWPVPSRRWPGSPAIRLPVWRQLPVPRPQGVAPCRSPLPDPRFYPRAWPDPLLGVLLLQVLRLQSVRGAFTPPSARGLAKSPSRRPLC
jgi:hypothetical protein